MIRMHANVAPNSINKKVLVVCYYKKDLVKTLIL